jgi:hypothetical protein
VTHTIVCKVGTLYHDVMREVVKQLRGRFSRGLIFVVKYLLNILSLVTQLFGVRRLFGVGPRIMIRLGRNSISLNRFDSGSDPVTIQDISKAGAKGETGKQSQQGRHVTPMDMTEVLENRSQTGRQHHKVKNKSGPNHVPVSRLSRPTEAEVWITGVGYRSRPDS